MYINPINNITPSKINFGYHKKPNIERNRLKILLSQDIWAPKLMVKMPETPLEKEVLLEILKNRLKLDKFTKLSNEKFNTIGNFILYKELSAKDPHSKDCISLKKELEEKGSLNTYINYLNKELKNERRINAPELLYFNNIFQAEKNYLERNLITEEQIDEFYSQILKNNINKDGKYSTEELINIIENEKVPTEKTTKEAIKDTRITKIYPKKQLLTNIEVEYEKGLRENFNIYNRPFIHDKEIALVRGDLEKKYIESIVKYPEIGKSLIRIYENIEKRFMFKINRIANVNIFALDIGFDRLDKIEKAVAELSKGIEVLKNELERDQNNQKLKDDIKLKEETLKDLKDNWGKWLEHNVEHEKINHQRMIDAGRESEYLYLTGENKLIKKYAEAYKIFKENNNTIPESYWT